MGEVSGDLLGVSLDARSAGYLCPRLNSQDQKENGEGVWQYSKGQEAQAHRAVPLVERSLCNLCTGMI